MPAIGTVLLGLPAVRLFAIVYLLLVVKMVAVGFATSLLRIRRKVYATPEDYALNRANPPPVPDEDIERIRRVHRNDLENILPFFAIGLFYALGDPSMLAARIYFVGFLVARVLHSVFYIAGRQPHRTIAFGVGLVLMLTMLATTLVRLLSAA